MTIHECPKCGEPMEYQEPDPDIGIVGGWDCFACGYAELDVSDDSDLDR